MLIPGIICSDVGQLQLHETETEEKTHSGEQTLELVNMSLQGFDMTALDSLNPGLGLVMQTSGCSPGGVEEFL